jgi:hypothetical protein
MSETFRASLMSAYGTKQTWEPCSAMSAFGGKAEIALVRSNVR